MLSPVTREAISVNDLIGSYSSFCNAGWMVCAVSHTRSVYPSGVDFAAIDVPMTAPAPPRLSTTTDVPSRSESFGAITRATMSVPPPGANGTMMRIGRAG